MAPKPNLQKMSSYDNACSVEGCNVLRIVEARIEGIQEVQENQLASLLNLITAKFENLEKNLVKESNRIDELRKGDIDAVRVANDISVKRAELLSQQLVETAETVRKNTDTLATTLANQLQQITARQDEKIATLERINWENSGKAMSAPDIQKIVAELARSHDTDEGVTKGQQLTKAGLITIMSVFVGILTIITLILNFFHI